MPPNPKRKRVLVIDDNEDVRMTMRLGLEAAGFDVALAADGRRGLAMLRQAGADVVVTDILMPEQDGIETLEQLREEFPQVHVIAISGAVSSTGFDYLAVPRELGAAHVLRKPFDIQELIDILQQL